MIPWESLVGTRRLVQPIIFGWHDLRNGGKIFLATRATASVDFDGQHVHAVLYQIDLMRDNAAKVSSSSCFLRVFVHSWFSVKPRRHKDTKIRGRRKELNLIATFHGNSVLRISFKNSRDCKAVTPSCSVP